MNKKVFRVICILIILVSMGFFLYSIYNKGEVLDVHKKSISEIIVKEEEKREVKVEEENKIKLAPDVDLEQKRKEYNNNDIVGRLEIPSLFNVLIAKGRNNEFYLDRDIRKKRDRKGTEFLDYRVNINSNQLNIYGHNTRDEHVQVPFKKLSSFTNKKFFDENPYIIFQNDQERECYKIMAIKEVRYDEEHLIVNLTGKEFVQHLDNLLSNTLHKRELKYDENSKVLVLQTCAYFAKHPAYYVIIAKKI